MKVLTTMEIDELSRDLKNLVDTYGIGRVVAKASELELEKNERLELTIVCNLGPHPLPQEIIRGELFLASKGSLDFTSQASILTIYSEILSDVAKIVKSKKWAVINIVPFGHVTLSMQIKLLCYRVLGIETVDWFYLSSIGYVPLKLSIREIATEQ